MAGTAGRASQPTTASSEAAVVRPQDRTSGHRARQLPRAGAAAATRVTGSAPRPSSASANWAALTNRSAGSFSSAMRTAASTCDGMVWRCSVSERGSSVITRAMIACAVAPVNGGSAVSISYSTHPKA